MLATFDQSISLLSSWNGPYPVASRTVPSHSLCCQNLRLQPFRPQRAAPQRSHTPLSRQSGSTSSCSKQSHTARCQPDHEAQAVCAQTASLLQACSVSAAISLLWPTLTWAQEGNPGSEIVQEAVQGASSGSLTERLTSAVFFLAVATLGIITLGVLYLSLSQFIDSRNEKADLSKWTPEERNAKGPAVKQQQQRSTKRKQYVSAKGGGKGFGDFGDGEREF